MIKNYSFEDGWSDVPAGNSLNQRPVNYGISWLQPGEQVLSAGQLPCDSAEDPDNVHEIVGSIPEMVHMHLTQLPENEQLGMPDALILEGDYTYKMHAVNVFSATLHQQLSDVDPGANIRAIVPLQVHHHGDGSPGACAARVSLGNESTSWFTFKNGLSDRVWEYIIIDATVPENGEINLTLTVEGRAQPAISFFTDSWSVIQINDEQQPTIPQGSVPAYVRESYSKKTHVAPQDVTIERFLEIAEIAFVEGSSVTKSVDDACLHAAEFNGNPEQPCSVIFWDIKSDERGDYRRFVDDYYGNIDIEFMPPEEPEEPEEPEALVLTYPTTHMPPVITQQFGPTHGGIDLRSSWRVWGDELVAALDSVVVLVGDSDIFGHQILTRSTFNGQTIEIRYAHLIQDSAYVAVGQHLSRGDLIGKPGNTGLSTGDHLHFSVKIGSEYVDPEPLIDFPDETTPPVEPPVDPPVDPEPPTFERWTNNYVGLHMQFMASSTWDEYVSQGHPSVMKSFSCGDAVTIGRLADTRTLNIWRHYEPDPGGMLRNADGSFKNDADMRASAQRWLDYYSTELNTVSNNWNTPIPELLADIDVLTSLNEVMAAGNPEIVPAVTFDVMFAEEIDKRFGGLVKGGLLNVAVGNPAENEVQYLLPVAKICHEKNHFIGYHCYWTGGHEPHGNYVLGADVDGEYRELWPHLAGRWQAWDDVFTSSGYYPQYYGGETGTVYVPPEWKPWELHHGDGWKAAGSFEWYIQLIDTFNAQMLAWNATHGNRHRGAVLFTYPAWGWDSWTWNDGDTLLLRDWAVNLTANDN